MTDHFPEDGATLTCARCDHAKARHANVGCMVEKGDAGSGSVADAVFCRCDTFVPKVEDDLWWGYLCPAMANIGVLKQAQSDLVALGSDWAEAGRILSRVQSFYVDAAFAAAQRYIGDGMSNA